MPRSGYSKTEKKRSFDDFLLNNKQTESSDEDFMNAEEIVDVSEDDNEDMCNKEHMSEKHNEGDRSENVNEDLSDVDYDPGNWKNIEDRLREILVKRGPIREDIAEFPEDGAGRSFDDMHYTRHMVNGEKCNRKWLVYSNALDRVFCFCCKLFKQDQMESPLAGEGTKDWENLSFELKSHETSREHLRNAYTWAVLEEKLQEHKKIDTRLEELIKQEKDRWKEDLLRIVAAVKIVVRNNLTFVRENEMICEGNNGFFYQLVQMITEFDLTMYYHTRRIRLHEKLHDYPYDRVQKEVMLMLADEIKSAIIKRIQKAKYFSIILHCTTDAFFEERISLTVRCVNCSTSPVKIEEFFLEFLEVDDTSELGLFNKLKDVLKNLKLDINDVRGQAYDNRSTIKGKFKDMQKRLLQVNPRAFYTPGGCHNLALELCDIANCCSKASSCFGVIRRIYSLFSSSAQSWQFFTDNVSGFTLKPLPQTRWESHVECVKAIKYQASELRDALVHLANTTQDPMTKSEAKSLVTHQMDSFEFLFLLCIWYNILHVVNIVSEYLQTDDMHTDVAIVRLKELVAFFNNYRENGFNDALIEAKETAKKLDVEPYFHEEHTIRRKKQFEEDTNGETKQSPLEFCKVQYLYLVDQVILSLERRLEQFEQFEQFFGFLLDLNKIKYADTDSLQYDCDKLGSYLSNNMHYDIDGSQLVTELQVFKKYLPSETTKVIEVFDYINERAMAYPNLWIAYRVLLTIPIIGAPVEGSFSKSELIKSYLQSTMSKERLDMLAMLSIEKHMLDVLDYKSVIDNFASQVARRMYSGDTN